MKTNKLYKISAKIKTHTNPLCELLYEKIGILVKETKSFYFFDSFRVKKSTVTSIQEVIG